MIEASSDSRSGPWYGRDALTLLLCRRMEVSCLELALEGERLCKLGDYRAGVSFFEAAIQVGTEDLQVLSAIYSQLGNAYFHLHDYAKALEFHRHDLTLTRLDLQQLLILPFFFLPIDDYFIINTTFLV